MEIKKLEINGREIIFVNDSLSTKNGFKHVSHMFIDGIEKEENTSHYINRTWECYRFETCMKGVVNKLIYRRTEKLKEIFKNENDYAVLNKKRREEFEKYLFNDDLYAFYNKIYEAL